MSLFKRKQSKDKDLGETQALGNSPPVNAAPAMIGNPNIPGGSRAPGPVGFAQANGSTPPLANGPLASGRRMTSNPQSGPNGPMGPPVPSNYSNPNGPSGAPGPANHPNGVPNGFDVGTPPQGYPQQSAVQVPRPPSTAPMTSYPWSTRPVRFNPSQASPPTAALSPFPRYGLSVPAFPSHSGHMLLFGGLVHDSVRNDLWSVDVRDCVTMQVKTKGDAPMPRVGHASAIADRIMLIWGGDTKVKQDDSQDEGLYILDLRTQEWTSVPVSPGPVGRYGHAACMHDTRFFIFGGQAEGAFMNDLWTYDIKQLTGSSHRWEQIQYTSPPPPRRTGHVLIAHQGNLYVFGGTDGKYHYNDTWSFDMATGIWTELSCIGYIPVPREGHAAAIVDDVIYIFGGRDVNGKDLGDLAAFRITNQRWYMFQNMGPAPSARSGHAMVAAHGKIFVVGGEANVSSGAARDDPSLIHVLDTTKIKYPPDNQAPRQVKTRPSEGLIREDSPPRPPPTSETPQSVRRQLPTSNSIDSLAQAASPSISSSDRITQLSPMGPPLAAPIEARTIPRSDSHDVGLGQSSRAVNGPPQRPRRDGDEDFRRVVSPTNTNGPGSPSNGSFPRRVTSPSGPASPTGPAKTGFNTSILGTRSPSPRLRMTDSERPAPPPDAFYYGRSPTANGFSGRPGSVSGSAELMRELKAKDTEVESGRRREAALRVIIGKAVQDGFTVDNAEQDIPNGNYGADPDVIRKLADALMHLKQEKAAIQNDLVNQLRIASDRAMDAERLRRGALQEAAFFRAKAATLESNSPLDVSRMEKERINDLERQIAQLSSDHADTRRDLARAQDDTVTHKDMHTSAVEREAETLRRVEDSEEAHRQAVEELDEVQAKAATTEATLREHTERLVSLSSVAQQREAERDHLQTQLDEATAARDEHVGLIEQAQAAISAAGGRTAEMEALYNKANSRVNQLEVELSETRVELEGRVRGAELASERFAELENAYAKSREEADSLRTVTTGRLGELLDSHKELRADEGRNSRGHQEQLRALEEEGKSLRKMLREAGQRVDAAEDGVSHHRQKARDLEASHQSLRGEMRSHRTRLLNSQSELAKWKELHGAKDVELRNRDVAVTEIETRCTMLRNLLADHGIAVNDIDLNNAETPSSHALETKLRERTRAHETSQREVEELSMRCQEAEDKVESLGRLVERLKDARSPTFMSMRSPSPQGDPDRRVMDAERKIAELESTHKEKLAALEGDYQTAVRYVKGTEKMLKRMKDELNKQKATNGTMQTELDSFRGRSSVEPGMRSRDVSGRSTPGSAESDLSRRLDKLHGQHNALQAEFQASRDVLTAREREVEVLRMRCEEAEREVEVLRDDLAQAQHRITTLLEMGQTGFPLNSDDEDDHRSLQRDSGGSNDEALTAYHKFTKEPKPWERSRSPQQNGHENGDDHSHVVGSNGNRSHQRHSSEYSGDWAQ